MLENRLSALYKLAKTFTFGAMNNARVNPRKGVCGLVFNTVDSTEAVAKATGKY